MFLIIGLLLIGVVAMSGCIGKTDITEVAKQIPIVQEYLEENPDAEIKVELWDKETVKEEIKQIKADCGKDTEIKSYIKATITEDGEKTILYIDPISKSIDCAVGAISISEPISEPDTDETIEPETHVPTELEIIQTACTINCNIARMQSTSMHSDSKYCTIRRSYANDYKYCWESPIDIDCGGVDCTKPKEPVCKDVQVPYTEEECKDVQVPYEDEECTDIEIPYTATEEKTKVLFDSKDYSMKPKERYTQAHKLDADVTVDVYFKADGTLNLWAMNDYEYNRVLKGKQDVSYLLSRKDVKSADESFKTTVADTYVIYLKNSHMLETIAVYDFKATAKWDEEVTKYKTEEHCTTVTKYKTEEQCETVTKYRTETQCD